MRKLDSGQFIGYVAVYFNSLLEVFWREPRVLGDSRQHPWTDLFAVVKREDEIGPALAGQRAVGAGLAFDLPTDAVKCR